MHKTRPEISDPEEWLRQLSEEKGGFSRLVGESNGLARAAYRLARACCSIDTGDAPRLADLQAATGFLAARLGGRDALPIESLLPVASAQTSMLPVASEVPSVLRSAAASAAESVAAAG